MPIKKLPQLTAWSWSRLQCWEQCPAKCKYKNIDKLPEPQSPALAHGSAVHAAAEKYISDRTIKGLPEALARFKADFAKLRRLKPTQVCTERKLAYRRDWTPCDWFDPDCWLRVVLDLQYDLPKLHERVTIDYKTGKVHVEAQAQLRLYNVCAFAQDPPIETAHAEYWYLDEGEMVPSSLAASEVAAERRVWEARVAPMLADRLFLPTPTYACKWCAYRSGKGPCHFQ
jgi:RecB family exonuclease